MSLYARIVVSTGKITGVYSGESPHLQARSEGEEFVGISQHPNRFDNGAYAQRVKIVDEKLLIGKLIDLPPPEPLVPTIDEVKSAALEKVDRQRGAIVNDGVVFNGVRFQTRPEDRENLIGAVLLAFMAIMDGAQPKELRWHGGDTDFVWIAEDNSLVPMDAFTVIAFGKATAVFKSAAIFNARALKDFIAAAPDEAALNEIDTSAGWPGQPGEKDNG